MRHGSQNRSPLFCSVRHRIAPVSHMHAHPSFCRLPLRSVTQIKLFESAAATAPTDPELHVALGVLHHLGRAYGPAVAAFERALQLRPGDYRCSGSLGWGGVGRNLSIPEHERWGTRYEATRRHARWHCRTRHCVTDGLCRGWSGVQCS